MWKSIKVPVQKSQFQPNEVAQTSLNGMMSHLYCVYWSCLWFCLVFFQDKLEKRRCVQPQSYYNCCNGVSCSATYSVSHMLSNCSCVIGSSPKLRKCNSFFLFFFRCGGEALVHSKTPPSERAKRLLWFFYVHRNIARPFGWDTLHALCITLAFSDSGWLRSALVFWGYRYGVPPHHTHFKSHSRCCRVTLQRPFFALEIQSSFFLPDLMLLTHCSLYLLGLGMQKIACKL